MQAALVFVKDGKIESEAALKPGRTVVGREEGCQIRIPVASVSRKHCELSDESGLLKIRDLDSSNGTFVNNKKVGEAELTPGDVLNIGGYTFVVKINGQPAEIDASAIKTPAPPQAAQKSTKADAAPGKKEDAGSVLDDMDFDPDDSSISDFDFDFGDDDEAPKL